MTGYQSKKAAALDKLEQWGCEAFNDWWDSDYDDSTNPYEKDTFAYWAWAGWQAALAQPAQEPLAVHQFRSPHCSDWYDGIPDHHDGHGPYEVRTLYTHPLQRTRVVLTDKEIEAIWKVALFADYGVGAELSNQPFVHYARAIVLAHEDGLTKGKQ